MRIKAIIFDWDGTLNKSLEAIYNTYAECLKKLKLPKLTVSKFKKFYESDYKKFQLKIGITQDKIKILDKIWYETYRKQKVKLYPDVKKFLIKIKKYYSLSLVTGGSFRRINEEMHKNRLDNIFDVIITGKDTSKKKPYSDPLKICVKKLNFQPKNCVYVGDMDTDIMAAKKIKIIPIAVTWGYHDISTLKKARPKYIARNFNELFNIIKSL